MKPTIAAQELAMPTLNLEITPATASAWANLDEEQRRFIELSLAAQLARLLPPVATREETVREIEEIAERAEGRALADGLTLEALSRLVDASK
jgi:hypothetical protein